MSATPVTVPVTSAPRAVTQQAEPEPSGQKARIAVLGASGYTGLEFMRIALMHPGLELSVLVSRDMAGRPAADLVPGFDPRRATLPPVVAPSELSALLDQDVFDTLVCCLPHGGWLALQAEQPFLARGPARIVDLSSDHRDGSGGYVYGLPEAGRAAITAASRVANPGCYPTAAALALLPACEAGWISGPVTVSALSGASGAGRARSDRTSFVELSGGAAIYGAGEGHAHVAEMRRVLSGVSGADVPVGFVPQLAPMARGILLTATVELAQPMSPAEVHDAYAERFKGAAFVRLLEPGEWPETRCVRSSNRCDLSVTTLHDGRWLLATAAIDNLVKGAAGQAIQNLNLMLGWPEDWGLPVHGSPW